jgi:hypothetical protein
MKTAIISNAGINSSNDGINSTNAATINHRSTDMNATINSSSNGINTDALRAEIMLDLVDDARYPDFAERVLARIGDDAVTLYDSADHLLQRGFDIDALGTLLMHRCINGTDIAELVEAANNGTTIGEINRQLADRRPFVNDKGAVISMNDVSEMGIDLALLTACRGRSLTDTALFDLLSNVKRGWTKADDANTGLAFYADGEVA